MDLAAGGLLLDIGKLQLPSDLSSKADALSEEEVAQARTHVELGLKILDEGDPLPQHVREMIRTHHEREDGSGYPDGISGSTIPLVGRMAGVVDEYCAMITYRSDRRGISKHAALQELYRARGKLHSAEVIEQFVQCLGVYPAGSLVELSDGRVAVVMAQNAARRLFPRVMVLTGPDKQLMESFQSLDLMQQPDTDQRLQIATPLPPGAYDIDPAELYL